MLNWITANPAVSLVLVFMTVGWFVTFLFLQDEKATAKRLREDAAKFHANWMRVNRELAKAESDIRLQSSLLKQAQEREARRHLAANAVNARVR